MTKVANIHNSKCLKCSDMQDIMVKVEPMVFCPACFEVEFIDTGDYYSDTGEVETDCKNYQNWLASHKKYIVK